MVVKSMNKGRDKNINSFREVQSLRKEEKDKRNYINLVKNIK